MSSLYQALHILHTKYRVPHVVISSIPLEPWLAAALPETILPSASCCKSHLLCISSSLPTPSTPHVTVPHRTPPRSTVHAQCVPLIPGYFSGVGDLFSALLLAHFNTNTENVPENLNATYLSEAVSQALTKTHAILLMTQGQADALPEEERLPSDDEKDQEYPMRKIRRMRGRELALVRGQDLIRGIGISHIREMMLWGTFWDNASA